MNEEMKVKLVKPATAHQGWQSLFSKFKTGAVDVETYERESERFFLMEEWREGAVNPQMERNAIVRMIGDWIREGDVSRIDNRLKEFCHRTEPGIFQQVWANLISDNMSAWSKSEPNWLRLAKDVFPIETWGKTSLDAMVRCKQFNVLTWLKKEHQGVIGSLFLSRSFTRAGGVKGKYNQLLKNEIQNWLVNDYGVWSKEETDVLVKEHGDDAKPWIERYEQRLLRETLERGLGAPSDGERKKGPVL
jgi:hypothetical protein